MNFVMKFENLTRIAGAAEQGGQGGQSPPQLSRQGGLAPPAKYSTYKFEKLKVIKLLVSYLSLSEAFFMNVKFR